MQAHKFLCIDENSARTIEDLKPFFPKDALADVPKDLATAIAKNFPQVLGELMSESLKPDSELNTFFRELSIQSLKTDRITLGLREAIDILCKNNLEMPVFPPARHSIYALGSISLDEIEPLGFPVVADMADDVRSEQSQALQLFTPVCRSDKQISVFVDFQELLRNQQCQPTNSGISCRYEATRKQNRLWQKSHRASYLELLDSSKQVGIQLVIAQLLYWENYQVERNQYFLARFPSLAAAGENQRIV